MPQKSDIRALTGLRGVAALWVVVYHLAIGANLPPGLLTDFLRHGYMAVDVFFPLSGFILALSYAALFRDGFAWPAYGSFLWRRVARVYPLYLAATALIGVGVALHHRYSGPSFLPVALSNLLMVQSWGFSESIIIQAWSVSVEVAAYLAFPILLWLAGRSPPLLAGMVGVACVAALAWLTTVHPLDPTIVKRGPLDVYWGHATTPLLRCVAEFTLGLLAYRVGQHRRALAAIGSAVVVTAMAIAFVALAAMRWSDLLLAALAPLLVVGISARRGPVSWLLATPAIVWLGEVSYALYLTHVQFLKLRPLVVGHLPAWAPAPVPELLGVAAVLGAALVCAWVLFRFFERPARSMLQRLSAPKTRRQVALSEQLGREAIAPPR